METDVDCSEKIEEIIALLQKNFECPICLDTMRNAVTTKCSHKFCHHCIAEALGHSSSIPCPLCKKAITKRSLQKLDKWNQIVDGVRGLVSAFQQDMGRQLSPPAHLHMPLSQTTPLSQATPLKQSHSDRKPQPRATDAENTPPSSKTRSTKVKHTDSDLEEPGQFAMFVDPVALPRKEKRADKRQKRKSKRLARSDSLENVTSTRVEVVELSPAEEATPKTKVKTWLGGLPNSVSSLESPLNDMSPVLKSYSTRSNVDHVQTASGIMSTCSKRDNVTNSHRTLAEAKTIVGSEMAITHKDNKSDVCSVSDESNTEEKAKEDHGTTTKSPALPSMTNIRRIFKSKAESRDKKTGPNSAHVKVVPDDDPYTFVVSQKASDAQGKRKGPGKKGRKREIEYVQLEMKKSRIERESEKVVCRRRTVEDEDDVLKVEALSVEISDAEAHQLVLSQQVKEKNGLVGKCEEGRKLRRRSSECSDVKGQMEASEGRIKDKVCETKVKISPVGKIAVVGKSESHSKARASETISPSEKLSIRGHEKSDTRSKVKDGNESKVTDSHSDDEILLVSEIDSKVGGTTCDKSDDMHECSEGRSVKRDFRRDTTPCKKLNQGTQRMTPSKATKTATVSEGSETGSMEEDITEDTDTACHEHKTPSIQVIPESTLDDNTMGIQHTSPGSSPNSSPHSSLNSSPVQLTSPHHRPQRKTFMLCSPDGATLPNDPQTLDIDNLIAETEELIELAKKHSTEDSQNPSTGADTEKISATTGASSEAAKAHNGIFNCEWPYPPNRSIQTDAELLTASDVDKILEDGGELKAVNHTNDDCMVTVGRSQCAATKTHSNAGSQVVECVTENGKSSGKLKGVDGEDEEVVEQKSSQRSRNSSKSSRRSRALRSLSYTSNSGKIRKDERVISQASCVEVVIDKESSEECTEQTMDLGLSVVPDSALQQNTVSQKVVEIDGSEQSVKSVVVENEHEDGEVKMMDLCDDGVEVIGKVSEVTQGHTKGHSETDGGRSETQESVSLLCPQFDLAQTCSLSQQKNRDQANLEDDQTSRKESVRVDDRYARLSSDSDTDCRVESSDESIELTADSSPQPGLARRGRVQRRRYNRIQPISDDSSDEDVAVLNHTSSSALSSQSEPLDTQGHKLLEKDCSNLKEEIAMWEAKLAQTRKPSPESLHKQAPPTQTRPSQQTTPTPSSYESLSPGKRRRKTARISKNRIIDDEEEVNQEMEAEVKNCAQTQQDVTEDVGSQKSVHTIPDSGEQSHKADDDETMDVEAEGSQEMEDDDGGSEGDMFEDCEVILGTPRATQGNIRLSQTSQKPNNQTDNKSVVQSQINSLFLKQLQTEAKPIDQSEISLESIDQSQASTNPFNPSQASPKAVSQSETSPRPVDQSQTSPKLIHQKFTVSDSILLRSQTAESQVSKGPSQKSLAVDNTESTSEDPEEGFCSPGYPSDGFPSRPQWSFVASGIKKADHMPYITELCGHLGCSFKSKFTSETTHVLVKPVAHVVVYPESHYRFNIGFLARVTLGVNAKEPVIVCAVSEGSLRCQRTLKYFQGVAGQKWVLSVQWVIDSINRHRLLPEADYEIQGDTVESEDHYGPQNARLSSVPLLSHHTVCCLGTFTDLTRDDLGHLVEACGGVYVGSPARLTAPGLTKVIVVESLVSLRADHLRRIQRQNRGVKVVIKEWLLDSIGMFDVRPFDLYLVSANASLS